MNCDATVFVVKLSDATVFVVKLSDATVFKELQSVRH